MNFYPFNWNVAERGGRVVTRDNLAVLHAGTGYGRGHLCGYVAFRTDEIPVEWHGDYHADGIQGLSVHGGITYCEVAGDNDAERAAAANQAREAYLLEHPEVSEPEPVDDGTSESAAARLEHSSRKLDRYRDARTRADEIARSLPYSHVVFGFDCAHADDDANDSLRDFDYVMKLAEQMRDQLLLLRDRVPEYRAASPEHQVEIMDEIRAQATMPSGFGLGIFLEAMRCAAKVREVPSE